MPVYCRGVEAEKILEEFNNYHVKVTILDWLKDSQYVVHGTEPEAYITGSSCTPVRRNGTMIPRKLGECGRESAPLMKPAPVS